MMILLINFLNVKGILSNVTLNNKVLTDWKVCLTNNFIPNYQKEINSSNQGGDVDFVRKIKTSKNLLTNKKLK